MLCQRFFCDRMNCDNLKCQMRTTLWYNLKRQISNDFIRPTFIDFLRFCGHSVKYSCVCINMCST